MSAVRRALVSLHLFHWVLLAVVAISTFTVFYYHTAAAACYGGQVLGRSCYHGYFTNVEDHGGDSVLPVIANGDAIPTYINTADELYNLVRAAYNSGSNQRQTGAAFIYSTMMGLDAPGAGRTVTNAQWDDLHERLRALDQAGKIDWTGNVSVSINSYWQGTDSGFSPDGTNDDDTFYSNYKNEPGIQIRDYNNNVVYELLRRCANPVGVLKGIPAPQQYKLTPHVDTVTPNQVEAGGKVSVTSSVDNTGDVASDTTKWEITKIVVAPGKDAPHEDDGATVNAAAPCEIGVGSASGNYFQGADATCENVAKGSGTFNLGSPAQNLKPSANDVEVGDLPAGSRVCFALSVKPRSYNDDRWAHSEPRCTIIGKKPKLQIWGGDIKVRGDVETGTSIKSVGGSPRTYGSWVEYGLLAIGANRGMASGSGLRDGSTGAPDQWNRLTFANVNDSGASSYGHYSLPLMPALSGQFTGDPSDGAPSGNLGNLASGTYKTTNLTITDSSIGQQGGRGKSIIIVASGTVTIDGDITYKGPGGGDTFTDVRQIPQVVIVANKINIKGAAERIDAWLLTTGANGAINTCSDVAKDAALTVDICDDRLVINGPVETAHLYLRRTAGSGTGGSSGNPAEIFNLRADAYIWSHNREAQAGKAQTVFSQELPPRF